MIQISLAWLLSKARRHRADFWGATKLNHLEEAVIGLDNVKLTEEETRYLKKCANTAHNLVGILRERILALMEKRDKSGY